MEWFNKDNVDTKAMRSYLAHRVRLDIVAHAKRPGVSVFGGLVRRSVAANVHIAEHIDREGTIGGIMDPRCFVDTDCDVDLMVQSPKDVMDIVSDITERFTVVSSRECTAYGTDTIVYRVVVAVRTYIVSRLLVGIDILHVPQPVLDFDVNSLAIDLMSGQMSTRIAPPAGSGSLLGGEQSMHHHVARLCASISTRTALMVVLGPARYAIVVPGGEYDVYLARLFAYRLAKMIKDGWRVANILVPINLIGQLVLGCGCCISPENIVAEEANSFIVHTCAACASGTQLIQCTE